MTASDIISNALTELGVLAPGESLPNDQSSFCLNKLNRILDNWNAEGVFIYGTTLFQGTLTANHNPHTIGISANTPDFAVSTVRPPAIEKEGANLVLTDVSPNIFRPLTVVDDEWWMNNPVPSLATQIPYYLYYNASWPNGQIYLWPVPTTAYDLRILIWTALSSLAITDTFTMPPGYEDAVTLTLAEQLSTPMEVPASPGLIQSAMKARSRVLNMNMQPPSMVCDQAAQSRDSLPKLSIANFDSGFFN